MTTKTKKEMGHKLTEDDLFVAINNWCQINEHAEDYEAMQRVKKFLEIQLRLMKARRSFPY